MVPIFLAIGLLMMVGAVPLLRRKVRPNSFYGLRVGETLDDSRVWYEANARSAKDLFRLGIAVAIGPMAVFAFPWNDEKVPALICCALMLIGALVYAARGLRTAREVEQEFRNSDRNERARRATVRGG